jgi:hypothetical protein
MGFFKYGTPYGKGRYIMKDDSMYVGEIIEGK